MPTHNWMLTLLLAATLTACDNKTPPGFPMPTNGDSRDSAAAIWRMPDEGEPHERTWMALAHRADIWTADLLPRVRADLALIANTISRFEPVTMLVQPGDRAEAEKLLDDAVEIVEAALDDMWMRDTGPCFVVGDAGLGAVDLNFNGWGRKQAHERDAAVAAFVARTSEAAHIRAGVVGEGGGIEVDGEGTALVTESCFVIANRNPGLRRAQIEAELKARLGLMKVIWLPGIAGADITDGHTDFYARFVRPGVVVAALDEDPASYDYAVTRAHLDILRTATDAQGRRLEVVPLRAPAEIRTEYSDADFAAGYVNFYVCNQAVIVPQFGDAAADAEAKRQLERLYPGRTVVQLDIDGIAAGGGGIHCATQQQPRLHSR